MSQYILALDQGTTSSRAILFDHAGTPVAMAQKEIRQIFPQPGWVEHDPEEIWQSQLGVAQEVLFKAKTSAKNVAAIGIANQRETTVMWDRASGKPIANAIVWQDRRTAKRCENLKSEGREPDVLAKTGLVLDAYFSASKISWLLDHTANSDGSGRTLRERADAGELAFGTIDTWLIWKLTGGRADRGALHLTDITNASRTQLYNIHNGDWDDSLAFLFGVPPTMLPEVKPSSGVLGHTHADHFGMAVPIAAVAGDQQAALFGQACTTSGLAKNTYGTGCFMLMHTGEKALKSTNGLITTAAAQALRAGAAAGAGSDAGAGAQAGGGAVAGAGAARQYALEGSVFMAGAVVQWLRDGLGLIKTSAEVEALAMSVPDAGGVTVVPAFAGLGAPYWDPRAQGAIFGMTRGTTKAHIARAALESIAFQTADVLRSMEADADLYLKELRVDGGASANNLLMQFQADLLGVPVVRPKVQETTALGAAYLAGLAVGFWKDQDEITALWQREKVFEPQPMNRDEKLGKWQDAIGKLLVNKAA